MKNVSLLIVTVMIGVITMAIVMTAGGYMNRRVELQSSLSAAMEQTVGQTAGEVPDIVEEWGMIAESIEVMAVNADTDGAWEVFVYGVDAGKGMLAMKVQERFFHPNGMETSTAWERTVINDRQKKEETECYEVRFYRSKADMLGDQNCYKAYTVQEGQVLFAPVEPVIPGARFAGWLDCQDYVADFSQPVEESRSYYADWE